MKLPDISVFYTPETALREEVRWILSGKHTKDLEFLLPRMEHHGIKTVLELGCGSGITAFGLPAETDYLGIDKNPWFLGRARLRNESNPKRRFRAWDARNWEQAESSDLSMAFGFLKHFALDEWDRMVATVLRHGRFGAFDMQLLHKDLDDGTEYHHVFVTERRLRAAVSSAGHEVVDLALLNEGTLEGEGTVRNMLCWTRRRTDVVAEPQSGSGQTQEDRRLTGEPGGGRP